MNKTFLGAASLALLATAISAPSVSAQEVRLLPPVPVA